MNQWYIVAAAGTLLICGWVYAALLFYKFRKAMRSWKIDWKSAQRSLEICIEAGDRLADTLAETSTALVMFGNAAVEIMDKLDLSEVPYDSQVMLDTSWEKVPGFIKAQMQRVNKFFRDRNPPFKSPPPEDKKPPKRDGEYYD